MCSEMDGKSAFGKPSQTSNRKSLFLHNKRLQLLAFEKELFSEQTTQSWMAPGPTRYS